MVGVQVWEEVVLPVVGGVVVTGAVRITGLPGKHVPPGPLSLANELPRAVPLTNGWLVELGWETGG